MKFGMERRDALSGGGYAVSAHLLEGRAAHEIKKRFPSVDVILVRGLKDEEEPVKQAIASMLEKNGYLVTPWDGTRMSLAEYAEHGAVLTRGGMHDMVMDADANAAEQKLRLPHIWWQSMPREAFSLPADGVRYADLVLSDPTQFTEEMWVDAVPYATRLGVLFDRDLFSLVYSSYDPATLLARGCRLVQNLLAEDAGNVRARLAFGERMAQVVDRITDCEMTAAEALAVGMVYETKLGAKLGVSNPRKLSDLEGVLTYHGLPNGIAVTGAELAETFTTLYGGEEHISLTLPTAIGKCRTAEYATEMLIKFIGEMTK